MIDFQELAWPYYLVIALQIICVIHVIKSRNEFYWIWLILFMPGIGCFIYILIHRHSMLPVIRIPIDLKIPMMEKLNDRWIINEFKLSDTLENRINYANVLLNNGEYKNAINLLNDSLKGPLRNHITLLFTYAKAQFADGNLDETIRVLEKAEAVSNNEKIRQRKLLLALSYEGQKNIQKAEDYFIAAQGGFTGEARTRYGLFLKGIGKNDEAVKMFHKVIESCRISSWSYRQEQKIWLRIAKDNVIKEG